MIVFLLGSFSQKQMQSCVVNGGMKGALVGLITGPLMTSYLMRNEPHHAVYDRCVACLHVLN